MARTEPAHVLIERLSLARVARARRVRAKREADAFVIWRLCTSARWSCTKEEVAEATGLTLHRVESICEERGWKLAPSDDDFEVCPVDEMIARENLNWISVHTRNGRRVSVPVRNLRPRRSI